MTVSFPKCLPSSSSSPSPSPSSLRVSLSPLRSHKFRHNFTDTPSEICHCNQGIEDTNHFLFLYPNYATPRATLAASIMNILQKNNLNYLGNQSKLYLYGHPSIISSENRKILLSTIKYIKSTLRFSTELNISGLFTSFCNCVFCVNTFHLINVIL